MAKLRLRRKQKLIGPPVIVTQYCNSPRWFIQVYSDEIIPGMYADFATWEEAAYILLAIHREYEVIPHVHGEFSGLHPQRYTNTP
jgi:hypothetical protein